MNNFNLQLNTKIIFGKATEEQIGEEAKRHGTKALLHYGGGSIKKTGLYDKVTASLQKAGVPYVELGGVQPNPRAELVYQGIELCKREKVDIILGIGGGSAIDSSKAIAVGTPHDGDFWDFYGKHKRIEKALPVGTIITLPATGTETSMSSVIQKDGRKIGINSDLIRPAFSIMNPELTYTLPKKQTVAGVADMYAHIAERYFTNTQHTDVTDGMCEAVMRAIIKNGRQVIKEPNNYDVRAEIMLAGTVAHNGILGMGREEDWASHLIEHELSAMYDATHGEGLSVIIPAWMKYVYNHDIATFAQYGRNVWGLHGVDEQVATASIEATKTWFKELGLPTTLGEIGVDDTRLVEMAKLCGRAGSFVRLNADDIEKIYRLAL